METLYSQDTEYSCFEETSPSPEGDYEWLSFVPATFSTVSHTREAGLCEDRPEFDPATAEIHVPTLCKVAGTVYSESHNAVAVSPLLLLANVMAAAQSVDSDVEFVATVNAFALFFDTGNPLFVVDAAAIVLLLPVAAVISSFLQDLLGVQCLAYVQQMIQEAPLLWDVVI